MVIKMFVADNVSYAVGVRGKDGTRIQSEGYSKKAADSIVAEFNAEAQENFRMESGGPVKAPKPNVFVVVRATTMYEEA